MLNRLRFEFTARLCARYKYTYYYYYYKVVESSVGYDFLLVIPRNYPSVCYYRCRGRRRFWSQNANFLGPVFKAPVKGSYCRNLVTLFGLKNRNDVHTNVTEKFDDIHWLSTVPESYRQTDRQTDRRTDRLTEILYQYRASVCWR